MALFDQQQSSSAAGNPMDLHRHSKDAASSVVADGVNQQERLRLHEEADEPSFICHRCRLPFVWILLAVVAVSGYLINGNLIAQVKSTYLPAVGTTTMQAVMAARSKNRNATTNTRNDHDNNVDSGRTVEPSTTQQKVFLWPMTYDPGSIGELRQILRDGIDRSSNFQQTYFVDDPSAIWVVDLHRVRTCQELVALVQESLTRRRRNYDAATLAAPRTEATVSKTNITNRTSIDLTWRIVLFDFNDAGTAHHLSCMEGLARHLGKQNVEYACRQFYQQRNVSMVGKNTSEPFGLLGRPAIFSEEETYGSGRVHLFRYPVRTDMVEAVKSLLLSSSLAATANGTTDIIALPRHIDAASFTPPEHSEISSVTLRGYVSQTVKELELTTQNNITTHVGLAGCSDECGRSTPQEQYMRTMMNSKIVVTAQRDRHEDHYRFFEAISSGAMVMTDPMHPLPVDYEHGRNVVVYTSLQELQDMIRYYLGHPKERIAIARAGYELAMAKHRSWHVVERVLLK